MDIDTILLDLEVLKQVDPNDKLAINLLPGNTSLSVDANSFFSNIKRKYNGYNRESSVNYLVELVDKIEKYTKFIVNSSHDDIRNNLKNAIVSANNGLKNLQETYNDDSIIVAKLTLIINKLRDCIIILNNDPLLNNVTTSMMTSIENNSGLE
tara:strand:- start:3252 stop:3710 length:459 start_codon:yes stop_codon:yes gene_type:complete